MLVRLRATVLGVVLAATPGLALAWDYPGHRIVGAIADFVLHRDHPKTERLVGNLLLGGPVRPRSLSEVAVFPDCAKNEPEYCGRDPSAEETQYVLRNVVHKSFHFTNSPLQQKTYLAGGVGTQESDIVQMIGHAVAQLRGGEPYTKRDVRLSNSEAVWLLAHLLGDIHQPLHVGQIYFDTTCRTPIDPNADRTVEAVSTFGGNLISLDAAAAGARNLHLYWDSTSVSNAMRENGIDDEKDFVRLLAQTPLSPWQSTGGPETWAGQWVAEIMPLAEAAHARLTIEKERDRKPVFPSATVSCTWKTTLDADYHKWASARAREQLQKAGWRLAAILKAIFEP